MVNIVFRTNSSELSIWFTKEESSHFTNPLPLTILISPAIRATLHYNVNMFFCHRQQPLYKTRNLLPGQQLFSINTWMKYSPERSQGAGRKTALWPLAPSQPAAVLTNQDSPVSHWREGSNNPTAEPDSLEAGSLSDSAGRLHCSETCLPGLL